MEPSKTPTLLKFWSIWIAFVGAFVCYLIFLKIDTIAKDATDEYLPIELIIAGASFTILAGITFYRWLIIPKITDVEIMFKHFIVMLAMGESLVFYALFLIPNHHDELQWGVIFLSALCILQIMPIFVKTVYKP